LFAPQASLKYCPTSIPDRPTSRTGKAIVERKRAIDYGHCRIGVASTATVIHSQHTVSAIYGDDTESLRDRGVRSSLVLPEFWVKAPSERGRL